MEFDNVLYTTNSKRFVEQIMNFYVDDTSLMYGEYVRVP